MFQKTAFANCLETFDERNAISFSDSTQDRASNEYGPGMKENATNVKSQGKPNKIRGRGRGIFFMKVSHDLSYFHLNIFRFVLSCDI